MTVKFKQGEENDELPAKTLSFGVNNLDNAIQRINEFFSQVNIPLQVDTATSRKGKSSMMTNHAFEEE